MKTRLDDGIHRIERFLTLYNQSHSDLQHRINENRQQQVVFRLEKACATYLIDSFFQERLERIITDATSDQSVMPSPVFKMPAQADYDHQVRHDPRFVTKIKVTN
jgi:hypothetical protein